MSRQEQGCKSVWCRVMGCSGACVMSGLGKDLQEWPWPDPDIDKKIELAKLEQENLKLRLELASKEAK